MKKLGILFMAVMIAAIAGCAGDDSSSTTGDLEVVQNLEIDASSTGRTVVLVWSEVADVEGYKVYFKADASGNWVEAGDVTTTTFTHAASVAGEYSVMAYDGDDTSSAYATAVSTMPNIVTGTYKIYDQHAPADYYSGFQFGENQGTPGYASDTSFDKDIYAYDETGKGDLDVWLYSANFGQYATDRQSNFLYPDGVYGNCDPAAFTTSTTYELYTSDSAVFIELPYNTGNSAYVKMYELQITAEPTSNNGTEVSFRYEYQPNTHGFTLFTSNF